MIKEGQMHEAAASNSILRAVEVNPQNDPRWETLMNALPNSLIYHHPTWLQVLEEAYGYKPVNLACEDANGQLRGILPLVYIRGLLTGRRFSSLPRTPVAGPLAYDNQAMTALLYAACDRIRNDPGTQLQLKVSSNTLDGLMDSVIGTPWSTTYVLELPSQPELLRIGNSRNHARIRWAVNKANRLGIQVCPAETERDLRAWYNLYLDTMRRVAIPPRPYRFFEVVWRQLQPRGLMKLLLAKQYEAGRSRLLAGSLFLMFGHTIFYAFTGWRREDQSLRPNDAIHWHAIHDACTEGFRYYDFGEVDKDDAGLAEFKSKWGAEPKSLYRYYYPAPRELETGIFESSSHTRQFVSAVWQRLPIKATVLLSDLLHHYI